MSVQINGTNGLTFADNSSQTTAASGFGFKNRLINGNMAINQRNAGASVTPTNSQYLVDRWYALLTQASKFTVQQNAGSITPPVGFKNYLGITSSSAYSIASSDIFTINQGIEGLNVSDLAWGTANAKTVTLSFQVYSSLTGTFGGSLRNAANTYAYPFSYSIPVANTWTSISVTVPGSTAGVWATDNTAGIYLAFGLGVGSTYSAAAGSWTNTASVFSATGATSVVGTNGATFYITGVQLEKGSTATSFDYRPYGTELALCQRYYYKLLNDSSSVLGGGFGSGVCNTTTTLRTIVPFPVPMRTAPSAIETTGVAGDYRIYITASVLCTATPQYSYGSTTNAQQQFTVASGLTAGQAGLGGSSSTSSNCYLAWSAEL